MGPSSDVDVSTQGRRLGYLRRRLSLLAGRDVPKKEVAAALGVTGQMVGEWESDRKRPDVDRLDAIAAYYGTTAEWILWGRGHGPDTPGLGDSGSAGPRGRGPGNAPPLPGWAPGAAALGKRRTRGG